MKWIIPAVFGVMLASTALAETRFLADMDDMPLAPGLTEIDGERLVFDKAEGRILRTAARGAVTSVAVREFYVKTLPSLGWLPVSERPDKLLSDREGERLEITLEGSSPVVVRFALQPR
ncbi:hypothetical protein [Govanella unica]|uniref:Uncharacterized protein n=1 Tax=Govanella unica TaxID=2975056 RepID=A0A9X3TZH9_9PROT|nr:hypothetical protein [Govania unica]MDA5194636.1 hypothetical protein [Govania unica]